MSCVLRIEGEFFNVGQFLRSTNLKPYEKHIKGANLKIKKNDKSIHKTSGCSFDLSDADFNRFDLQKKDAIRFLKDNFDKLKDIYSFGLTKKENPIIDFAIETRMNDVGAQFDYFEPELIKLVGKLDFGIEISQYHPASDRNEKE
jgi:hypothetical protein